MKKGFVRVVSAVIAAAFLFTFAGKVIKDGRVVFGSKTVWSDQVNVILTTFKDEKWIEADSDVEVTAYYSEGYMSAQEIRHIITKIATELGVKDDYKYELIDTETGQVSMLTKKAENAETCVKITTVENIQDEEQNDKTKQNNVKYDGKKYNVYNYLYVRIDLFNSPQSGFYYMTKLNDILAKFDIDQKCTMNFHGKVKGRVNNRDREKKVKDVFASVGAREVDRVDCDGIYSVYGYTTQMQGHVTTDGRKININVSTSYNEETDETNIYIASPVLSVDY